MNGRVPHMVDYGVLYAEQRERRHELGPECHRRENSTAFRAEDSGGEHSGGDIQCEDEYLSRQRL